MLGLIHLHNKSLHLMSSTNVTFRQTVRTGQVAQKPGTSRLVMCITENESDIRKRGGAMRVKSEGGAGQSGLGRRTTLRLETATGTG